MSLLLLAAASLAYAVGGLFMKQSFGVQRLAPTMAFLGLFGCGSVLQALAMKSGAMGVSYVLVLGMEAVAAMLLSVLVLRETYSMSQLAAVTLILAGIAWLRQPS